MIRRTSGVPLLYAGRARPAGFALPQRSSEEWGLSVYARHWHASRLVPVPVPVVADRTRK